MILKYNQIKQNKIGQVLDNVIFKGDVDIFCSLLNIETKKQNLNDIKWDVDHEGEIGGCYITGIASENSITITLKEKDMLNDFDRDYFVYETMVLTAHELIHLEQYDRIGCEKLKSLKSGYQKGVAKWVKSFNEEDLWNEYYSDSHEIMAYAHNLFCELMNLGDAKNILKQIELYVDELLTYRQFRTVFSKDSKVIKKLLNYTYNYLLVYGE